MCGLILTFLRVMSRNFEENTITCFTQLSADYLPEKQILIKLYQKEKIGYE
jgi:hypothetical protein